MIGKLNIFLVVMIFIISFTVTAKADVQICINDKYLDVSDNAIVKDDRIFVPMRSVFEEYGAFVTWDEETGSVVSVSNGKSFVFKPYSNIVIVDGQEEYMEPPSFEKDGKIYASIRFVSNVLGTTSTFDIVKSTLVMKTSVKPT